MTRRILTAALGVWVIVGVVSAFVPLSVDEASWLAVERKMALGRELYVDVVDNKPPLVFFLVRGLDVLPGPFEPARAVIVGMLAAVLAMTSWDVAKRFGVGSPRAAIAAATVALGACVTSAFSLTIELAAIAFIGAGAASAARGRPILSAVAAFGIAFDPRAIMLLPAVVVIAAAKSRGSIRTAALANGLVTTAFAATLLHPDLRFGLIEVNLASRGAGTSAAELGISAARGLILPFVAVFVAWNLSGAPDPHDRRSVVTIGLAFAVPAVAVVFLSRLPFDKYWVLVYPAIPFVIGARAAPKSAAARSFVVGLFVLALVPGSIQTARVAQDRARRIDTYRRAAAILQQRLPEGSRFAQFDANPFLVGALPAKASDPSPLLALLALPTSRQDTFLFAIRDALGRSDAIVDDGGLEASVESVSPSLRPIRDLFLNALDAFPCEEKVDFLTVRFRVDLCDDDTRPAHQLSTIGWWRRVSKYSAPAITSMPAMRAATEKG
jgi:hypothetical protein